MSASTRSERVFSVNFDNIVLKQWLRDKGAGHRRETLKKLKEELQNLGLSRRQVHRGLLQLATKPWVTLTRHATHRRYRSKKLENNGRSVDVDIGCEKEAAFPEQHSPPRDKDRQSPDSTQMIFDENTNPNEEEERIEGYKTEVSSNNSTHISDKRCKSSEHRTTTPQHSFDNILEPLDSNCSAKMNMDELNNRRASIIVSTADAIKSQGKSYQMDNNSNTKSTYKDNNQPTNVTNENVEVKRDTFDSIGNKVAQHHVKLKSPSAKKEKTDYAKSYVHKKLDAYPKSIRVQVDSSSSQDKQFKGENQKNVSIDKKSTRIDGNVNKRRVHETTLDSNSLKGSKKIRVSLDVQKKHDKRTKKNIQYKLRRCFGDCRSVSEDEQEQGIIQERFKRRRKNDSVDSCDSGVCFSEEYCVSSNDIEVLKVVHKAVPDSTVHEEICKDTSSNKTSEKVDAIAESNNDATLMDQVESVTDGKYEQSQNNRCNVDNNIGNNNESNLEQSMPTLDTTETSSEAERSNISVFISEETDVENRTSSCSIPVVSNSGCDITEDLSKSQTTTLDFRDLKELLNMSLNETCQVTSNGNALSIREKVGADKNPNTLDKDTDSNLQSTLLQTTESGCEENIERATNVTNDKDAPSKATKGSCCNESCDVRKKVKSVPVKIDLCNLLGNVNEITLLKSKLNDIVDKKSNDISLTNSESNNMIKDGKGTTVQDSELNNKTEKKNETPLSDSKNEDKNAQSSQVPKVTLRVLSSAELGARWCPTPVRSVISTTSQPPSTNTVTTSQPFSSSSPVQTASMTIPVNSTSATRLSSSELTTSYNLKRSNIDPKFSEAVCTRLVNVCNFILNTRMSHIDHSKSLLKEFESLEQILNIRNYVDLISGVINILNKELLKHQPLSLRELLYYVPAFTCYYRSKSSEQNNSNGYQNAPTSDLNTTLKQNINKNIQGSQNVTSVQHVPHNVHSSFTIQTPAPTTVTSNPIQQNLKEKVTTKQNNLVQNTVPMNYIATNYGIQYMSYRMPAQRPFLQQNAPPNGYFMTQHPVSNIHASQGIPIQISPLLVNTSQSGIRYNQPAGVQIANTSILHNYLSPANGFCAINVSNYPAQQNMNQTQGKNVQNGTVPCMGKQFQNTVHGQPIYNNMVQGIQSQNMPKVPQNIPVINNTAPTVQNTFVPNIPQSVPRNIQNNEQVYKKIPVRIQARVPQYNAPQWAPPSQQTQFTKNKRNSTQVLLKPTLRQFDILKYLSGIQKIMLLGQINFYFSCTAWIQQKFTSEKWQVINRERSMLLHFQTLLKPLVEKTIKDVSAITSQSSMFENNVSLGTEINIPTTIQISVKENEQIRNQAVELTVEKQSNTMNINGCDVSRQKTVDAVISENKQNITDNLPNKQSRNQGQKSVKILQDAEIQKNKQTGQTLVEQNQAAVTSILGIRKTSDNNVNEKDVLEKELTSSTDSYNSNVNEQSTHNRAKTIKITPRANLVTVEIPADNYEVIVVGSNTVNDSEDEEGRLVIEEQKEEEAKECEESKNEEAKECEELKNEEPNECEEPKKKLVDCEEPKEELNECEEPKRKLEECEKPKKEFNDFEESEEENLITTSLKDTTCETSQVDSTESPNNTEHSSDENMDDTLLEETTISHIADVRSITLEAFEKMDDSYMPISNSEENIEEEEMKICLICSKPSTIVCTVCFEAKYCSKECYSLHWEEHNQDCRPVKSVYLQLP